LDVLQASEAADPEAITLIAAGLLAEHFMRGHEGLPPDSDWALHGSQAQTWLQIGEDDMAQWEDELRELLDAV
jgi:hypothetical protein